MMQAIVPEVICYPQLLPALHRGHAHGRDPGGGRAHPDGAVPPEAVLVAIQDAGVGLDPQTLERLFETFYTTKPDGLGMGLPISRSIIAAHGGHLWATAQAGGGATFQFTLPTEREGAS